MAIGIRPLPVRVAGRLRFWWARALQAYRIWGPKRTSTDTSSRGYRRHLEEEIAHYGSLFEGDASPQGFEPAPEAWTYIQDQVQKLIEVKTGHQVLPYLIGRMAEAPGKRMISLGSGPAGVELAVAEHAPAASYLCFDVNPGLLALGRANAAAKGLPVEFAEADLNVAELPPDSADLILCHASLHHLVNLDHAARQMRRALRKGGEIVAIDLCTRNGYRMWPENRRVVHALWRTLPARLRINHTAAPQPRLDRRIWERDMRASGMECAKVEDVLPTLDRHFERSVFVPHSGLVRRFFDSMYGPNYDLTRPLDKSFADWVWNLDCSLLQEGEIRPETFFGIWR